MTDDTDDATAGVFYTPKTAIGNIAVLFELLTVLAAVFLVALLLVVTF